MKSLNINNKRLFNDRNKKIIEILPVILPKIILYILVFLFKIIDTDNSNKKSMAKFKKIIKSTYTFKLSPP